MTTQTFLNNLKRLSVDKQISFAFGAICLAVVLIGATFFLSLRAIEHRGMTEQARAHQKWAIIEDLPSNVGSRQAEVVQHLLETNGEEMARHEQIIRNLDQTGDRILADFKALLDDRTERLLFARLVQARKVYLDRTEELLALSRTPRDAETRKEALTKQSPAFFEYHGVVGELLEETEEKARQSRADTSHLIWQLARSGGVLIGLAMLMTAGTSLLVVRVNRRLRADNATLQNEIIGRERTEVSLRKNEARLVAAQAVAKVGSWETDLTTGTVTWSDETYRIFETKRDEFPGTHDAFMKFVHPEDRPTVDAAFVQSTGQTGPFACQHRILRPGGSVAFLEERWQFLYNERSEPTHAVGTCQDITERRGAELEIERALGRLKEAQRIGHIGDWEWDMATGAISWSPQVFEIVGRDPNLGPPCDYEAYLALYDAENAAVLKENIGSAIESGEAQTHEVALRRPDGHQVYLQGMVLPRKDEGGKLFGLFGTVQDITERKKTEETLRESEAGLGNAQRIAHLGSWECDVQTGEIRWSDEVYRLFGLSRESFHPTYDTFFETVHPADRAAVRAASDAALAGGTPYSIDHRVIHSDRTERVVHEEAEVIFEAGKPLFMAGTVQDITERKRAEAALTESESKYHSLFENMLEGYAYCQTHFEQDELRDFTYLEVNSAFEKLTGLKDVVGKKVSDVIPGIQESTAGIFDLYGRVALTGIPEKLQVYLEPMDIWLSITAYSAGREHFVAVFDNITTRKRAESLLRESQKRLTLATESALLGIWDWNVLTNDLAWDAQMYALYGIREQDFSGAYDAWINGLHPDDRERTESEIHLAVNGAGGFHTEFRVVWPDGEIRHIEAHAMMDRSADGSTAHMIGVNRDITERKRTENAVRESNEKFHQLADNITDAFWIRSPDAQKVEYVSPAFERIWGRSVESLYASPQMWTEFILADDRAAVVEAFAGLTRETRTIDIEYRIVRPDQEIRWVRVRGFQVRDAADKLIRLIGIVSDITSRKRTDQKLAQSQEDLQRLNADLEQRVEQRTMDLVAATKEAERANRAKSEFLSRTSHELRTPLNAILGFGQLLEMEEDLGADPRESVDQILNAGRHLLLLIDEVLNISHAESGSIVLSPEPIDVEQLVKETLSLVKPLCAALRVRLEPLSLPKGDWIVMADGQRLRQILLNLLANAIKYNRPDGTVKVECMLVAKADPPAFRFSVKDTGPGISAAHLSRLFIPFDRLDAERKLPHIVGTGLGLSLSKRLIELMGGVLGVKSVVGKGSTFWIDVPLVPSVLAETEAGHVG